MRDGSVSGRHPQAVAAGRNAALRVRRRNRQRRYDAVGCRVDAHEQRTLVVRAQRNPQAREAERRARTRNALNFDARRDCVGRGIYALDFLQADVRDPQCVSTGCHPVRTAASTWR